MENTGKVIRRRPWRSADGSHKLPTRTQSERPVRVAKPTSSTAASPRALHTTRRMRTTTCSLTSPTVHAADPIPNPPVIDWPFWYQFGAPGPVGAAIAAPRRSSKTRLLSLPSTTASRASSTSRRTSYSCKNFAGELTGMPRTGNSRSEGRSTSTAAPRSSRAGRPGCRELRGPRRHLPLRPSRQEHQLCAVVAGNGRTATCRRTPGIRTRTR